MCTHTAPYPAWPPSANRHLCTHTNMTHGLRTSDTLSGRAARPHTRPHAHNLRCALLTPKRGACVNTNAHVRVRTRREAPTGHTDPGAACSERLHLRPGPGRPPGGRLFRFQPLPGQRGGALVLIAGSPGQPRFRGSGLAVGEARSPHPGTCPHRPRPVPVPLRTSNCQWAACSSCFAWSAAQPAVSTNWLIITWCLSSSMFTDMAPPRSPLRPPCALAPRLTRPPLASRPRLIQIFTVRSDSPRLAARRPAEHAGRCSPRRPRRTDRGGDGTPFPWRISVGRAAPAPGRDAKSGTGTTAQACHVTGSQGSCSLLRLALASRC